MHSDAGLFKHAALSSFVTCAICHAVELAGELDYSSRRGQLCSEPLYFLEHLLIDYLHFSVSRISLSLQISLFRIPCQACREFSVPQTITAQDGARDRDSRCGENIPRL